MGSDRARVSFDNRRQWRLVSRQQGRVTLEADQNEADFIAAEELRRETSDFVGTCGTPDDGYAVQYSGQATDPLYDLTLSNGTMYVGGVRAFSFEPIQYSTQPDWLDSSTDDDYIKPDQPASQNPDQPNNELIWLLLREQEVSAVEDSALRDFALGGPDSSQRTRLIQRIVRFPTDATDCATAMNQLRMMFQQRGLAFIESTMRLESMAALKVVFPPQNAQPDLCAPEATGGYLKPDNQLIRIKIVEALRGGGTLIWGFDDASFMYRAQPQVTQVGQPVTTLKLLSRPIDEFHRPHANQIVEVLRSAAHLSSGADDGIPEVSANDFVAAADGFVVDLANDYDQDTQLVTLSTAIPDLYATDPNPLFVRVWESRVQYEQHAPVDIGDTGMQVVIFNARGGNAHPGDFWMVAARPGAPASTAVYPERYLHNPQPPDGPRLWICPLAIVTWTGGGAAQPTLEPIPARDPGGRFLRLDRPVSRLLTQPTLSPIADCREQFEDLVDLTKRLPGAAQAWPVVVEVDWPNDQLMMVDQFNAGLGVTMSNTMIPSTISEQTFQVTLDVPLVSVVVNPTPSASGLFRTPFVMRGYVEHIVGTNKHVFRARPQLASSDLDQWLQQQNVLEKASELPISRGIRCRVVLKGDTILDDKGNPLDGEAFGQFREMRSGLYTDLKLPSGNGSKGGDFNSWFFVGPKLTPEVAKIDPANHAVLPNSNVPIPIQVTFTRPVQNVTDTTFTLQDQSGTFIPGKVTAAAPTTLATFTPTKALPAPPNNKAPYTFTVTLQGSQIADPAGNQLQGDQGPGTDWTSSFQIQLLTTVSVDPPDGTTYAFGKAPPAVVITFTAPVDLSKVDKSSFGVSWWPTHQTPPKKTPVGGDIASALDGLSVTFTPTKPFVSSAPRTYEAWLQVKKAQVVDANNSLVDGAGHGVSGSDVVSTFDFGTGQ